MSDQLQSVALAAVAIWLALLLFRDGWRALQKLNPAVAAAPPSARSSWWPDCHYLAQARSVLGIGSLVGVGKIIVVLTKGGANRPERHVTSSVATALQTFSTRFTRRLWLWSAWCFGWMTAANVLGRL